MQTIYSMQSNPKGNQAILNYNFKSLQKWFYGNYMVLNPSTCLQQSTCVSKFEISYFYTNIGDEVLRITINTNLIFYSYLK